MLYLMFVRNTGKIMQQVSKHILVHFYMAAKAAFT